MLLIGVSFWMDGLTFLLVGLAARVLSGLGYACVCTVSTPYTGFAIAQSDYAESLNEVLGMIEFASGLGLMVGPALGAFVYYFLGFRGVFWSLSVLFILSAPVIYCGLGPDRGYIQSGETSEGVNVYTSPRLVVNSLAMGYAMALISFFDTAIAPHLMEYGVATVDIGIILAASDCGYTLMSLILSKILHLLSLKWVLVTGLILACTAYTLMGPWPWLYPQELWVVILGIACLSVSLGIVVVSTMPNLVKVATVVLGMPNDDPLADALSSKNYAGMLATYMSLGEVVGPLLGGYLVDVWGFANGAAVMGGIGLVLLVMFLVSERNRVDDDVQPLDTSET